MSRPMSVYQFSLLLKKIYEDHNPIRPKWDKPNFRCIKYVDPVYDNRTGHVFTVKLRGFGQEDKTFSVVNEERDLKEDLYDRIVQWLESYERPNTSN